MQGPSKACRARIYRTAPYLFAHTREMKSFFLAIWRLSFEPREARYGGSNACLYCYYHAMDDENLHQESYFTAYAAVINSLDPKAVDFDFMFNNLRNAVQISGFLTADEKKRLSAMLHILLVQSKHGAGA